MNPVPVMQLVELIRGIATEDTTYEAAKAFIAKLGKTSTMSEDFPAFIVNRILLPMINEAIYTLYEGVGSVESIDTAMRLGANHPMGPLQLADFIGLDTCLSVMQVLYEGLADSKYRPCPLLVKYVEAGWLGRKAKRGFYDYRGPADRRADRTTPRGGTRFGPRGTRRQGSPRRPSRLRKKTGLPPAVEKWAQAAAHDRRRPFSIGMPTQPARMRAYFASRRSRRAAPAAGRTDCRPARRCCSTARCRRTGRSPSRSPRAATHPGSGWRSPSVRCAVPGQQAHGGDRQEHEARHQHPEHGLAALALPALLRVQFLGHLQNYLVGGTQHARVRPATRSRYRPPTRRRRGGFLPTGDGHSPVVSRILPRWALDSISSCALLRLLERERRVGDGADAPARRVRARHPCAAPRRSPPCRPSGGAAASSR